MAWVIGVRILQSVSELCSERTRQSELVVGAIGRRCWLNFHGPMEPLRKRIGEG